MQANSELLALLRTQLPQSAGGLETIAYPYGEWDENLLRYVKQYGYIAGFTVRREANAAFVPLLKVNRSQVFATWTLEEFKKNLITFAQEPILPETAPVKEPPQLSSPSGVFSSRQQWAARHRRISEALESRGLLGQALDESKIALTIDPADTTAQGQRKRLESRIENEVASQIQRGEKLAGSSPLEARRHYLAALALNPVSQAAFDAARAATAALEAQRGAPPRVKALTHTVRPNETPGSLANLYYGDRSLGEVIEKANGLKPGAPLSVGRLVKIPAVPGIPFLRPD
jgi:nucleoid-associated protein YgaU